MAGRNGEISFKVVTHIGVLANYQTGWAKELNVIQWNDNQPKYDIRDWSPDHKQMSKGITLHKEEARVLMKLLFDRFKGIDAEPDNQKHNGRESHRHNEQNIKEEASIREESPVREETMPKEEASAKEDIPTEPENPDDITELFADENEPVPDFVFEEAPKDAIFEATEDVSLIMDADSNDLVRNEDAEAASASDMPEERA